MGTHTTRSRFSWARWGGVGVATLAVAAGCATANEGPLSASLTPDQYAEVAAQQCSGIPVKEQELGLLAYRDAISNAAPLKETYLVGKTKFTRDRGVELTMRAELNMTVPWLARVATCHIALARSNRIAPTEADPLLVAGATVDVEEAYTGFVVRVHVPDDAGAAEAVHRATVALTGPTGPATAENRSR